MRNASDDMAVVRTTDVGTKSETEAVGLDEFRANLARQFPAENGFAIGPVVKPEADNGSWLFTLTDPEGNEYSLVAPASIWKRKTLPDGTVVSRSPEEDDAMLSEISVLLLKRSERKDGKLFVSGQDRNLIDTHLDDTVRCPPTQGQEVEFFFEFLSPRDKESIDAILEPLREAAVEAFPAEREIAMNEAVRTMSDLRHELAKIVSKVYESVDSKDVLISWQGIRPVLEKIGELPNRYLTAADSPRMPEGVRDMPRYIEAIIRVMNERIANLVDTMFSSSALRHVREGFQQIADKYSFPTAEDFVKAYLMQAWTTSSYHYSIGIPANNHGLVPEAVVQNIANGEIYFSNLINGNNYSGGTAYGVPLRIETRDGKRTVLDARPIVSSMSPTSLPAGLIRGSLYQVMCERLLRGGSNDPDRGVGTIVVEPKTGPDISFSMMHGINRARVSVKAPKFLQYLTARFINHDSEAWTNLGERARMEYTDRSSTPDIFGGNFFSIALQNIVHRAGTMAAADGATDFIEWMVQKGIIESREENVVESIYRENNTTGLLRERELALTGRFDRKKIAQLRKLIDVVEQDLVTRSGGGAVSPQWEELLGNARHGVRNLERVEELIFERHDLIKKLREKYGAGAGVRMYDYFIEQELGVFGLVSILKDDEIRAVLKEKFGVMSLSWNENGEIKDMSISDAPRGLLEVCLGHWHALEALTRPHPARERDLA